MQLGQSNYLAFTGMGITLCSTVPMFPEIHEREGVVFKVLELEFGREVNKGFWERG